MGKLWDVYTCVTERRPVPVDPGTATVDGGVEELVDPLLCRCNDSFWYRVVPVKAAIVFTQDVGQQFSFRWLFGNAVGGLLCTHIQACIGNQWIQIELDRSLINARY